MISCLIILVKTLLSLTHPPAPMALAVPFSSKDHTACSTFWHAPPSHVNGKMQLHIEKHKHSTVETEVGLSGICLFKSLCIYLGRAGLWAYRWADLGLYST